MQNIKKYFMTLALLLTAVTGAWAQSSLGVKELAVPATWNGDNTPLTAADLPGFKASTYDEAKVWTGAPAEVTAALIYDFGDNKVQYVAFTDGKPGNPISLVLTKNGVYGYSKDSKFYYTAEITEWSLKPDADKKVWTLAEMPASNVELQVEYYAESNLFLGKEALADKTNIAVKNGETDVVFGEDGKSANTATEGNTVTVTYTGTKKLLGMTVAKKAASLIVNPVVGQVIGSDGKNYAAANVPSGVDKVAMIAYVSGSNGLAIALADESSLNWTTAKSTCEAKTPAFTGGTWKLPTQDEWKNMFKAFGGNNAKYTGLNNALAAAGGNGSELQTGDSYWSSSEIDENKAYLLYLLSSDGDTDWYDDSDKNIPYRVRACLAF